MATKTITELKTLNDLSYAQVGDYFPANRGAGNTGVVTYAPTLLMDPTPTLAANLNVNGKKILQNNVYDTNGVLNIALTATASAVNYVTSANAITTANPSLTSTGSDTNIGLDVATKGTGAFRFISDALTAPVTIYNGTTHQHSTIFSMANTAAARTVTFPDADGTMAYNALAYGGTNNSLTADNGGIVYSDATKLAILGGTATASKMLLSGSSTAPTWSTSTIPSSAGATALKHLKSDGTNYVLTTSTISDTPSTAGKVLVSDGTNWITSTPTFPNASATSGKIIKSDGTNWIASTATVSDSPSTAGKVLVSDGTNWITSTPTFPNASATTRKITVSDGTNWVASTETWAAPGSANNILKSDGTNWTASAGTGTGSPVLGTSPTIATPVINGFTDASSAASGVVGERLVSSVGTVALTTATPTNITSLTLTAGDWDIWAVCEALVAATTVTSYLACCVNETSGSVVNFTTLATSGLVALGGTSTAGVALCGAVPSQVIRINGSATYYLNIYCVFSISTCTGYGIIYARRRR